MKIFALFLVVVLLISCNNNGSTKPTGVEKAADTIIAFPIPGIDHIDSMEIVYYDDPYADSVKFSRFFTVNTIIKKSALDLISANLKTPFIKENAVKSCRSEGKIILHLGNEKFKTVYFSTKCDTCCYLYHITDGAFFYYQVSDSVRSMINLNKQKAKKPGASVGKEN